MSELAGSIDLALLPVWGWGPTLGPGHLDPARAATAAALIAPRVAVPIHWGTFALRWPLSGRATRAAGAAVSGARRARQPVGAGARACARASGPSSRGGALAAAAAGDLGENARR